MELQDDSVILLFSEKGIYKTTTIKEIATALSYKRFHEGYENDKEKEIFTNAYMKLCDIRKNRKNYYKNNPSQRLICLNEFAYIKSLALLLTICNSLQSENKYSQFHKDLIALKDDYKAIPNLVKKYNLYPLSQASQDAYNKRVKDDDLERLYDKDEGNFFEINEKDINRSLYHYLYYYNFSQKYPKKVKKPKENDLGTTK